jgi:GST-like protein
MAAYRLIASKGCGSAIVEMALELAAVPYDVELIPYLAPGPQRERLLALNPLGQVPTLILPDGATMTESGAMVLHLADVAPGAGIAPAPGSGARPAFLGWLFFLNAALYPTYTYGDQPEKWTTDGEPAAELKRRTDAHRQSLWRHVESHIAPEPFFLGTERSALDFYVASMVHWRPGPAWFEAQTPKLWAVAQRAADDPRIAKIVDRNFRA